MTDQTLGQKLWERMQNYEGCTLLLGMVLGIVVQHCPAYLDTAEVSAYEQALNAAGRKAHNGSITAQDIDSILNAAPVMKDVVTQLMESSQHFTTWEEFLGHITPITQKISINMKTMDEGERDTIKSVALRVLRERNMNIRYPGMNMN